MDDHDNSIVLEGFVKDLISNLSKFSRISILSPYSISALESDLKSIGADYILHGNIRGTDDLWKAHIQLSSLFDHKIIYAKEYGLSKQDFFTTQNEITLELVNVLRNRIDRDILSVSYKKNQTDLVAYEHYLIGMDILKLGDPSQEEEARKYFRKALELDPNFASAYTGLSLTYFNYWTCQLWSRWDLSINGAQEFAQKAIEIDPEDYTALGISGRTYLFAEEFEKAEHYVRKALRMNPNDSSNIMRVAFVLMFLGYPEESIDLYLKARELNPLHDEGYLAQASNFYFEAGVLAMSLDLGLRVDVSQMFTDFAVYLAATYFELGDITNMWVYWNLYLEQFKKNIYDNRGHFEEEALKWHIEVNPYQKRHSFRGF